MISGGDTNVVSPELIAEPEPEVVGDMRRANWGYEIGENDPFVSAGGGDVDTAGP